jgi:hypothetical protein
MPRGSHSWLAAVLASAALLSVGPVPAGAAGNHAARATGAKAIEMPTRSASGSVPVTMIPAGLSIEYPVLASYLGTGACPPPALAAELVRLGAPPLRVGGDSQDLTAPAGTLAGAAESWRAATLYQLPGAFWESLRCLVSSTHDAVTVGLNALSGNLGWAQQMAASARQAAPSGLSFSVGNEPDLYTLPNYSSLGTRSVDEAAAVQIYLRLLATLRPATGATPVVGPDLARPQVWRPWLPLIVAHAGLSVVGVHAYPLSGCVSPAAVTIPGLLSAYAAEDPTRLRWVVADATAAHVPAIISEANSASCGGRHGVSDTPAAAVWAVRFVVSALLTGFREVRFHLSGGWYDAFVLRGSAVVERPLASAIAAVNRWLPVGSTLRSLGSRHGLVATAVAGPGPVRELADNRTGASQELRLPGASAVTVQIFSPSRTGIATLTVLPRAGRLTLRLPAQSVAAVT